LKKNLALTGMMGVGKTSIGKILSQKLSMKFIDIDQIIERKLNTTISDIFKKKGEKFFRKYEEKITLNEVSKLNTVISLGGGAFINPKIRQQVQIHCTSFWLDLDVPLLKERLINSKKRPLLKNNDLNSVLEKIYKDRKKYMRLLILK
jgi:shikimate kinase